MDREMNFPENLANEFSSYVIDWYLSKFENQLLSEKHCPKGDVLKVFL